MPLSPCNPVMNKCNQSNWLPEIFFNALLRALGTYAVQINTKLSVPVGSVWWEWVICLAYERCIHFRSWLLIRLLSASGFRDGIHHVSVHQQACRGTRPGPWEPGGRQHAGPQKRPESRALFRASWLLAPLDTARRLSFSPLFTSFSHFRIA